MLTSKGLVVECTMFTITGVRSSSKTIEVGLLGCRPNNTKEGTGNHLKITEADLQKTAVVQNLSQINWYPRYQLIKARTFDWLSK